LGKVIDLKSIRKDSPEIPLTLEQGLKLLGLKKWPEDWEFLRLRIFLDGLTSIVEREGAAWVRFHRESVLEELGRLLHR
jgi:hypothetical protein